MKIPSNDAVIMRMKYPLTTVINIAIILCGQNLAQMHQSKMNGFAQTHTRILLMVSMYALSKEALADQDRPLTFTKLMMTVLFISRT